MLSLTEIDTLLNEGHYDAAVVVFREYLVAGGKVLPAPQGFFARLRRAYEVLSYGKGSSEGVTLEQQASAARRQALLALSEAFGLSTDDRLSDEEIAAPYKLEKSWEWAQIVRANKLPLAEATRFMVLRNAINSLSEAVLEVAEHRCRRFCEDK